MEDYITDIIYNYENDLQKVKKDGYAIQFVKYQTYEMCVKAIEQYPYSYQFIHNMTEDLWRLAVKKDGKMLHMIEDINLKLKITREIIDELNNL